MSSIEKDTIPTEVRFVCTTLEQNGFSAYLVGGCVRDMLLGREPKDWDLTTSATPQIILSLFEKTIYENTFGTVGVCIPKEGTVSEDKDYLIVEVTPFRSDGVYSDNRHPDTVTFSDSIEDDLKRRDFTINALAYRVLSDELIDLFNGISDLRNKTVRAVGVATTRFEEDALRMLRAVRFSSQLKYVIETHTLSAIAEKNELLKHVSVERIRDEFSKIIMSSEPMTGVAILQKLGLLKHFIPELEQGIGCIQGGAHKYDVFEHLLQALQHASDKKWPLEVRLAALLHDIGKPNTRRPGTKKAYTFYGHEVVGARMAKKICERLKYPKETVELVTTLVRYHMFFSDTEKISLSAVRRIVAKVGKENVWTLMKVRECDRVGMSKIEAPYRLRKYHAMIDQVLRDPISVGQLALDGFTLKHLGIEPGPRMGWILHALLEEVLDDPTKNTTEYLSELVLRLNVLGDSELRIRGERGKEKREEVEQEEIDELKKKHRL